MCISNTVKIYEGMSVQKVSPSQCIPNHRSPSASASTWVIGSFRYNCLSPYLSNIVLYIHLFFAVCDFPFALSKALIVFEDQ